MQLNWSLTVSYLEIVLFSIGIGIGTVEVCHNALMSNQTKVWKIKTGPLKCDKGWSRDPKSALFEILQNKEQFY